LAEQVVLEWTENRFGGAVVDPEALPADVEAFSHLLPGSLRFWKEQGIKVVWLEVPIAKTALIPVAVEAGFVFHHSGQDYVMMTRQLVEGACVPPYATHYVGAGGVVLNERQELLVVWERAHRQSGHKYYKLPGGALQQGEHIVACVQREVREETGIETQFESLVCFRHWHGYRYGKSDIYFVCRLSPLNHEIAADEQEIAECLWMPVQEYLDSEDVGIFNKRIVQAALDGPSLVPTWIEGYQDDPDRREIFFPACHHER